MAKKKTTKQKILTRHTIKRENIKGTYYYVERDNKGKITSKAKWHRNETARIRAKNKVRTSRAERYFKKRISTPTTFAQTTQEQAYITLKANMRQIEQQKLLAEYAAEIEKEKTIHLGRLQIATKGIINRQKANKLYQEILQDKVQGRTEKEKQAKIRKIINGRERLLKKRFVATIELHTNKGIIGIINIGGILPEKDVDVNGFWKGLTIESNEFENLAKEFKHIIGNPKIYTAKQTSQKAGKVTEVKTNWSFA